MAWISRTQRELQPWSMSGFRHFVYRWRIRMPNSRIGWQGWNSPSFGGWKEIVRWKQTRSRSRIELNQLSWRHAWMLEFEGCYEPINSESNSNSEPLYEPFSLGYHCHSTTSYRKVPMNCKTLLALSRWKSKAKFSRLCFYLYWPIPLLYFLSTIGRHMLYPINALLRR